MIAGHSAFSVKRALILIGLAAALAIAEVPWSAGPPIEWREDLDTALAEASRGGRPAVLSFHADWCSVCRRLERRTLRDPAVAGELERFVRIRVDATRMSPRVEALMGRYGVPALPALVFVDSSGEVLPAPRVFGYVRAGDLESLLSEVN